MNRRAVITDERELLDRICRVIREVEPRARVTLYGSRARGDAQPDSDWDLLVVLDGAVDRHRERAVHERLLELTVEFGTSLSALILSAGDWNSPRMRVSPLRANVEEDGIELTPNAGGSRAEARPLTGEEMAEAREDLIRDWLERAHVALGEAELLANGGFWNTCVSRLYYACFYTVSALLFHHGYRFGKHSSVQSLFNQYFSHTGRVPPDFVALYNQLYEARPQADYKAFVRFQEQQVRPWIAAAPRFVAFIEELLQRPTAEPPAP